jgi:hypothetical protein
MGNRDRAHRYVHSPVSTLQIHQICARFFNMCCCDCILEIGCCSTAIMNDGPIIEIIMIAWHCLQRVEHQFFNFSWHQRVQHGIWPWFVYCAICTLVCVFSFVMVLSGFNPAWSGHTVSWKIKRLGCQAG